MDSDVKVTRLSGCGLAPRNTRVVGGQDASPGSWPWQVSLNTDGNVACAGSLITDQWVLTAAHCITGDFRKIEANLGRRSQSGPNPKEESRGIVQAILHPLYDFLTNNHDIALLRLSAPVNVSDYIFPVCLAAANSTFHNGTSSWVAGWGLTGNGTTSNILQEVNLPIVGNSECKCFYPELTENMICAGLRAGGRDTCQGDSGAPLVTKNGAVWIQSGIVSFGKGCARPMIPGGYTRVSQYQDWISNITGNSTSGFVTFTSSGVDSDVNFTCPTKPPRPSPTMYTSPPRPHTTSYTKTPVTPVTDKEGGSVFDSVAPGGGNQLKSLRHSTVSKVLESSSGDPTPEQTLNPVEKVSSCGPGTCVQPGLTQL
ncbi:serine protease 27-like [Pagrus major]|uniref:serine protease 27-like n=1 Tax=Pagrus major TaxID=143350 RepID=UPI003CC83A55